MFKRFRTSAVLLIFQYAQYNPHSKLRQSQSGFGLTDS
jgi:hypothetical protein